MNKRSPWRSASWLGCAALAVCIALFGTDAGITWDEPSQAVYGDLVIRWFTSHFQDTSAQRFENLFVYGGLFEVVAQFATRISPLGLFETRHLVTAGAALGGVVAAGLTAERIAGPRAGFLAGAFLTLTPAWVGHALFNSKDIPFATAAAFATCAATRIATGTAPPRWSDVAWVGCAMGAALGIRSGGYFLFFYPLCACLLLLNRRLLKAAPGARARNGAVGMTLARLLVAVPIAWGLMIVAWPWAWQAPVSGPIAAMRVAANFPFGGETLFRGQLVEAAAAPRSYLPTWFAMTTPDFYFVALALGATALVPGAASKRRSDAIDPGGKTADARGLALVFLTVVLPMAGAVITRPPLYDGLRHFLFIFPSLAVLIGVAASAFVSSSLPRWTRAAGAGALGLAVALAVADTTSLHPYEYVYFNRAFGGLPAAQGRYETDYWGASYKEGFEWVVRELASDDTRGPLTVSSCDESSNHRLDYYRRNWAGVDRRVTLVSPEDNPEIFLEIARRYRCRTVEGRVIHTVSRQGVPLLYVKQIRVPLATVRR